MAGKIRSPEERARIIEAYKASGLSAQAFADREGLPSSTLYQWLEPARRRRSRRQAEPLRIARVVRRASTPAPSSAAALTIDLGGARVHVGRGCDRETLGVVLDLLASRSSGAS